MYEILWSKNENGQLTDVPEKEIEISGSWSLFWLPHELARMPFYT